MGSSLNFGPQKTETHIYGRGQQNPRHARAESRSDQTEKLFILNPRAATGEESAFSVNSNRFARTIPKNSEIPGIPTRLINNVPIRQWQWPDYVDN